MKKVFAAAALALASTLMLTVSAQQAEPPTPEQLATASAETRQGLFKVIAFNMGPINGMARGQVEFDAALAQQQALRVAQLAPMIPEVFAARDTRAFGVTTQALPGIWDNLDDFRQKAMDLEAAANTFAAVAAAGDRNETIAAIRAFGSTCGNCHRPYRAD
jgi:cytochrome c556